MVAVVLTVGRCCLRRCCVRCRRWGWDRSCCAYSSHCCAAHLATRAFFRCGVFLAGSWICSKWASNVVFFRWRRKRAYLLKESTWGMLSCNEGDAGLAAEVRKKCHTRGQFRTLLSISSWGSTEGFVPWAFACVSFHGLIFLGPRLVRFATRDVLRRPHSRAAWFSKKEKRKAKHKLRLDE